MNDSESSVTFKELAQGVVVIDVAAAFIAMAVSWLVGGWTLDAFAEALYLAGFAVILVGAVVGIVAAISSRGKRTPPTQQRGNLTAMIAIGAGMTLLAASFLLINTL
ncbi:MAG: hypothetical protein HY868_15165 [Chloroflexi bacterium]|nr:hypothetical protein [Chloroflexota bacterium]